MKIVTNLPIARVEGISNTLLPFVRYLNKTQASKISLVGINVVPSDKPLCTFSKKIYENFKLTSVAYKLPSIYDVVRKASNINDVQSSYGVLIDECKKILESEKPDLILINGTYFVPWCLYLASQVFNIPTILHYHGVLTKETEHWRDPGKEMFQVMEKQFDNKKLYYIFPSELCKRVVEEEVYGHTIDKSYVLPNPVPSHFFEVKSKGSDKKVGIVSRWSRVKNPGFSQKLAKYNKKHGNLFSINIVTDLKNDCKTKTDLSPLVKFRKPMANEQLSGFYNEMGIILSPSHFETYGNVPQEAIAANTPALVSSNMGVAETFKKIGLQDWVVDFSSTRNIYKKIREISKEEVDPKARRLLKEEYSTGKIHQKMLRILSST